MSTDQEKSSFRHESLQDAESIQELLKAVSSDEEGEIRMEPEGLLNLKLTASREEGRHRINLRITWQVDEKPPKRSLKVR